MTPFPDSELIIDTTGWTEILCDKCRTITCFASGENEICLTCFPPPDLMTEPK